MTSISVEKNQLNYQCDHKSSGRDQSWIINIENIRVIGAINQMMGDDDSDILVFVLKDQSKYFITSAYALPGWPQVKEKLTTTFDLELSSDSFSILVDNAIVLHPKVLTGQPLFKTSLKKTLRRYILMEHAADRELTAPIENYIESNP